MPSVSSQITGLLLTKTTIAKEVIEKLKLKQQKFGNPRRIVSDKGSAFKSADFQEYCVNEGIVHIKTTTGMPRTSGQVERTNRFVIPVLTEAVIEDETKWYKFVPTVQPARQRGIATAQFKLLFGVPMKRKEDVRIAEILEVLEYR